MTSVPEELLPFLSANTARVRRLGLAAAIGFGLFLVPCIGWALHALLGDVAAWIVTSCKGNEQCLMQHRYEELTKALILGALVLGPTVMGLFVFVRNRTPLSTPLAKAIASGGVGLRAVYPVKTTVRMVGVSVGDCYHVVFERERGEAWKWLVRAEDVQRVIRTLRLAMPTVPNERES
jgi:hypothetical protein